MILSDDLDGFRLQWKPEGRAEAMPNDRRSNGNHEWKEWFLIFQSGLESGLVDWITG